MASKQVLVAVVAAAALAVAFLPGLAVATEYVVGDDKGWTLDFNYTAWTETKQFVVGDTLVFEYNSGAHNVVEVGGPDFLSCTKPANAVVWNSGEDRVTLDKAGRRWFFCAVGQHCQNGMKLKITVLETAAPTPQPAPAPFA
ncbi:blue copper protein 1a-like [Aegilops tauschii subsp. strangulata]|uniref:blue copper protein 1a-like n=1 Tax=Aegilops tauschii subsp. strangulata TaxID=200361 RepID=UPI00098B4871|nr:blue copper protein 1a-like [Aegilops tauschii subsp. strangulata]